MMDSLFMSVLLVLTQLAGAYLRFLPFGRGMTEDERRRLWRRLLLWSVACLALQTAAFSFHGPDASAYKAAHALAWLPYFLISLTVLRGRMIQHFFVFGMQALWALILHTAALVVESEVLEPVPDRLTLFHGTLYLLFFALLLPWERRLFANLLPAPHMFDPFSRHWPIALLPFFILGNASLQMIQENLIRNRQMMLAMLVLPVFFFLMYRAMMTAFRQAEESRRQKQQLRFMRQQAEAMDDRDLFLEESRGRTTRALQRMRQDYGTLRETIEAGNLSGALALLHQRQQELDRTTLQRYCQSPIINTALSIYLGRAEKAGVRVRQKVNLPPRFGTVENEFAVLLSNLLENALHASMEQPEGEREIDVAIRHDGAHCVLEVANRCDRPVPLGADGLPAASREGHGVGMMSVLSFAKAHDAYVDFTQENGWVRISMYWADAVA